MRRLSLTLIASCGVALLSACASGGYAFNGTNGGGNIDSVVFTNGSGQVNDFYVSPNGNTPIQVNAVGFRGTGQGALVVPDATFTWAAAFAKPGTPYFKGPSPSGNGECGTPAQTPPQYYTILIQGAGSGPVPDASGGMGVPPSGGQTSPMYPGYELINNFQATPTVYVSPPLDPTKLPVVVPVGYEGTSTNYCVRLVATHIGDGRQGSINVVVSNSP